ncbi:MAG: hypothetical protein QOJ85_2683 [Solirubrobacteraceae bacterium]|nr:hypothetical protein [Solirubrobacteraceae bacterium]
MRSGAIPLAGWGVALVAIAVFGTAAYGLDLLPTLLLAGAGAAAITLGAVAGVTRHRDGARRPELLVRSSAATLVLTFGVTLAFVGLSTVGPGVTWPGVGLMIAGAGGLLREARAARRLRRDAAIAGSDT